MTTSQWVRAGVVLLVATGADASERQLAWTYTSDTLAPGVVEVEPWVTARVGRESFFYRLDQRVELEAGVVDGLQLAAYVNASARLFDVGEGDERARVGRFSWGGLSLEAKWKLLDAAADPLGVALYFEPTIAADEAEFEAKLILDKRMGNLLLAGNLVAEYELDFGGLELERELKLELDVGAAYQVTTGLSVGVELRSVNVSPVGAGWEHSAVFAGPVIAWRHKGVWAALSVMPQLVALKGPSPDLEEFERVQARLLIGFHL